MEMVSHINAVSWWAPNKACLAQWFKGAGFSKVNFERTVKLSADTPFVDAHGESTGGNQVLHLVDAYI
jgi:hypothetical protein